MKLIDSNSLIVLILGLMNPKLINEHSKTSIYDEHDYQNLIDIIGDIESLVVLPNIWTEVDNILNKFSGGYRDLYIQTILNTIKRTSEIYLESQRVIDSYCFIDIGLTDTLILEYAKNCEMLITSDSSLSDYAKANGIQVFDMIEFKNITLK